MAAQPKPRLKLAAFQGSCSLGNVQETLKIMKQQMEVAAKAEAELIVFPELFTTGYSLKPEAMRELAEPQDGPTFQQLSQWCKQLHIAVLYGYPEILVTDSSVVYYNSALFIGSDGTSLGNYHKQQLWVINEPDIFIPGNGDLVLDYNGIRIGVLICYDVEFPEAARNLALKGVQLVLVPTAASKMFYQIPKILVPARANENSVFVAYINHYFTQYDLIGRSCICDPSGEPVVSMGQQECLVVTTIDTSLCEEQEKLTWYMKERRPELYDSIVARKDPTHSYPDTIPRPYLASHACKMSAKLKLAAFQGNCSLGNVEETLKIMKQQMEVAAKAGAELIVFPELFTTGYSLKPEVMRELAEPQDGPTFQQLSEWCKQLHIAVLYGYPEVVIDSSAVYYNSALFIGSDGTSLGNYRKQHVWINNEEIFTHGNGDLILDYNGIRIGILICYDVEFPEAVRNLALKGVQLVLVPTAVHKQWHQIPKILVPARANENSVFVAYINHYFTQYDFIGRSCICDPSGEPVVSMGQQECLVVTTIDTSLCEEQEKLTRYMKERRPELYDSIVARKE